LLAVEQIDQPLPQHTFARRVEVIEARCLALIAARAEAFEGLAGD
jgi:hypothetical protein